MASPLYQSSFPYYEYEIGLRDCYNKFGSLFDQPVILHSYATIVDEYEKGNVLDLGAGKALPLFGYLKDKLNNGKYYSLDEDPEGKFDFSHTGQIKDLKFDLVVANQFFEHLTIDDSVQVVKDITKLMNKGGKFIITVPNIAHPNRQISNITHVTAWGHNSLYSLYRLCGLETIKIYRYSKRYPQGIIEKYIADLIAKVYRMDWADSIMVIATKS